MATSAHLAIRDAVAALFTAAPAMAPVYENRGYPLATGVPAQVQVYRNEAVPAADFLTGHPIDWQTELSVVFKARRVPGTGAEAAADALFTEGWARVMANQQLGGLAQQLTAGPVSFDQDEADTEVVAITWRLTVTHRTQANVIT